jgi:hypothetical protein
VFRSHLTYPHVASDKHTIALSGDDGSMPGMGIGAVDDQAAVPQIPAAVPDSGDLIKRLLLIGGVAAIVFLLLKHLNKSKSE